MAKFLITASYSAEGTKGLLKDGGSNRKDALEKVIEDMEEHWRASISPLAIAMRL